MKLSNSPISLRYFLVIWVSVASRKKLEIKINKKYSSVDYEQR